MKILTGFYNAEKFVERSIKSIQSQSIKDFTCYITHDNSTDNSVEIVEKLIKDDPRFILCHRPGKLYQVGNFDKTIRYNQDIADEELLIEVDGDDWLPDPCVFERIQEVYNDPNVWIANGSFCWSNGAMGFSQPQTEFNNLRNKAYTASHIRTWRAFLWRAIKEEDLRDENGFYWQWAGDLSFMYPMLEMSGPEHYKFMPEVNYMYNEQNPINEHKVDILSVYQYTNKIGSKPLYPRLVR